MCWCIDWNFFFKASVFLAHFPKKFANFQKLANLLQTKGNKFICNVKTRWINMLFPAKQVHPKFHPFIIKMHVESAKFDVVGKNLSYMFDVDVILGLPCILLMFECIHALIKVAQGKDVFVCDFVESLKMAQ
jgi:hypothetical protein